MLGLQFAVDAVWATAVIRVGLQSELDLDNRRGQLEKLITTYYGAERHRMTPDRYEELRVERVLVTHTTGHELPSDDDETGPGRVRANQRNEPDTLGR
jgi:hypothetical protein